jgi:hypothetical protein
VSTAYNDAIRTVRGALQSAEWLRFPFGRDAVARQVANLTAKDDRPYYFNPDGDMPIPATAWHVAPQTNRRREDSSYWVVFASGWAETAPGGTGRADATASPPPAKAPGKRTSARTAALPATGGTPAAPKPRAAPSGPATRPKAGTSTGKVWDLADALAAKHTDAKALRKAVIEACEAEGINASTASVQFGKWKSAQ